MIGFNYKYDSNNNVLVAEKLHDPGNSEVYTYQSDGQLASFARGTLDSDTKTYIATPTTTTGVLQSQNWTLDGQGNWDQTQTTIGSTTNTETRTQSANNEIDTQTVDSGAPTGLTYDANGNLTDDGVRKYVWDAFNRLVTVKTESGTVVACYFYDASGRRIRAVVSAGGINGDAVNGTTDFYHDGPRVIEEHDGSDAITQQYVYGNGEDEVWTLDNRRGGITVAALNASTGSNRLFYHSDRLSSVYGLTNQGGTLIEGYMYDPYGKQTVIVNPCWAGRWISAAATYGRWAGQALSTTRTCSRGSDSMRRRGWITTRRGITRWTWGGLLAGIRRRRMRICIGMRGMGRRMGRIRLVVRPYRWLTQVLHSQ